MSNEVGLNHEFSKLQLEYSILKEQVANQLEMLKHLTEVEGPNIKANYMMLIGQLEHRLFELKTEIGRWKRRFTLRQVALNRGEQPNFVAIEVALDQEFAEYITTIKQHLEEVKEASLLYHSDCLTEEETTALRGAYLGAVKKLHPDLNPGLPQAAVDLWNQIQDAYENKQWDQVRLLAGLVDAVVGGKLDIVPDKDGMTKLRELCAQLREKSAEIVRRTESLRSKTPFTYQVLLEDEAQVKAKQSQLAEQMRLLEDCIKEYEELWNHGK